MLLRMIFSNMLAYNILFANVCGKFYNEIAILGINMNFNTLFLPYQKQNNPLYIAFIKHYTTKSTIHDLFINYYLTKI